MTQFYSTRQVAILLAIKPDTLQKAIWQLRVEAPQKGPSGNYLWTASDIERTSWAIRRRDASDILSSKETTFSQAG